MTFNPPPALDEATHQRFEVALSSANLRGLVEAFKFEGKTQRAIYDLFMSFMLSLRAQGREREEDLVFDALDFIAGWCSPEVRWFDTSLTGTKQ